MKSFLLALQFLTTLPFGRSLSTEENRFAASIGWFPAVGLLIGGVQWSLAILLQKAHVPLEWMSLLILIANLWITGGLHLDGVADTIEGFAAGRDPVSRLRIMKDTRVGVFAIAAIFITLYAKIHAISFVISSHHSSGLLTAPMISRTMLVWLCAILPYAREEGTGKAFAGSRWTFHLLPALATCLLTVLLVQGVHGLLSIVIAVAITCLFSLYCYRKIGGFTGDTLGFLNELVEISSLIAAGIFL